MPIHARNQAVQRDTVCLPAPWGEKAKSGLHGGAWRAVSAPFHDDQGRDAGPPHQTGHIKPHCAEGAAVTPVQIARGSAAFFRPPQQSAALRGAVKARAPTATVLQLATQLRRAHPYPSKAGA